MKMNTDFPRPHAFPIYCLLIPCITGYQTACKLIFTFYMKYIDTYRVVLGKQFSEFVITL